MPPDDEDKQPTLEEREKIMKWIDLIVFAVDPDRPDPGRVTIRRLNRVEYNNTVRDLLGDTSQPASQFPSDRDPTFEFRRAGDVATQDATILRTAAETLATTAAASSVSSGIEPQRK